MDLKELENNLYSVEVNLNQQVLDKINSKIERKRDDDVYDDDEYEDED